MLGLFFGNGLTRIGKTRQQSLGQLHPISGTGKDGWFKKTSLLMESLKEVPQFTLMCQVRELEIPQKVERQTWQQDKITFTWIFTMVGSVRQLQMLQVPAFQFKSK